jgi:SWI/SNF-related matrix-associated actin-dependent regulator 1 of chromatin subfamily A
MAKQLLNEPQYAEEGNEQYIFEDMQLHNDYEMHQLCCKFESIEKFALPDATIVKSGKFAYLDKMLPKIKKQKERVLIFSQFTMILDIVEDYMRIRGHNFTRLDGSTKVSDRLDLIDDFNSPESDTFVFLLSTKAGGMGINLTSATTVFIHDIDFNPYNDKQAEDRCHRVGQTKEVNVYKLISKDSIEEGMLAIADKKCKLAENLVDSAGVDNKQDKKDLKNLLRQVLGD